MSDEFEKGMIALEEKLDKIVAQIDVDIKEIDELRTALGNQFPQGQAGDIYKTKIEKFNYIMHHLLGCSIYLQSYKKKQDDPHKDVKEARAKNPDNRNNDLC